MTINIYGMRFNDSIITVAMNEEKLLKFKLKIEYDGSGELTFHLKVSADQLARMDRDRNVSTYSVRYSIRLSYNPNVFPSNPFGCKCLGLHFYKQHLWNRSKIEISFSVVILRKKI